jgi:hypothetical protein
MLCALEPYTQYMIGCHKYICIYARPPSHVPYVAFLPPDSTCVTLALPSFPFLSSRLSFSVPVIDRDPECVPNSNTIGVLLAIRNSVSVGSGWVSVFTALGFWEGRARASQCHLAAGMVQRIEHKICMWDDILLVMFLISTSAFVKKT